MKSTENDKKASQKNSRWQDTWNLVKIVLDAHFLKDQISPPLFLFILWESRHLAIVQWTNLFLLIASLWSQQKHYSAFLLSQ